MKNVENTEAVKFFLIDKGSSSFNKTSHPGSKRSLQETKEALQKTKEALRETKEVLQKTKEALRKTKEALQKTKEAFQKTKEALRKIKEAIAASLRERRAPPAGRQRSEGRRSNLFRRLPKSSLSDCFKTSPHLMLC